MNDVSLLPHNEKAYEKLIESLKDNQMVSIDHATGTGKSFIMLKYLFNNRNKRILYMAPTYAILEQFKEEHTEELGIDSTAFTKLDTMIYRNLLGSDMEILAASYDIIVLDEYHRCGAQKWGVQVQKLLDIIKKKYKDTKVIGTTATEIRYLDNEKNMNEILFDGVEASRLSLADAMLQGILPVPIYINFYYSLIDEIDTIIDRIKKYDFYSGSFDDEIRSLVRFKNEIEESMIELSLDQDYLKETGKYLAFSSTIKSIERDKDKVEILLHHIDKFYSVHSNRSKEANKRILKEFRNNPKDITSVLFSVNLLNEGVHVKDVDALFFLRPTTSPIIYFQQLGRLLSYSRRKDQVVVFDLVNNMSKNRVIYELYKDLVKTAKEYIEKDPENKERYEKIVERFKIVDITGDYCRKVSQFKEKYTREELIEMRLNAAVDILLGNRESNEVEKFQANIDLFRYERYITLELFEKVKDLEGIDKPDIFSLTTEEFEKYLDGNKNIKEKDKYDMDMQFNYVEKYIKENRHVPSIFSSDENEKDLATFLYENNNYINSNIRRLIMDNLGSLSLLEKIAYLDIYGIEINIVELLYEVKKALSYSYVIKDNVIIYLRKTLPPQLFEEIEDLNIELKRRKQENENKDLVDGKKTFKSHHMNAFVFNKEFQKIIEKCKLEIENCNEDEYIFNIFKDIYDFILKYKKDIDFFDNSSITMEERRQERELFCKKIIFMKKLKEKGYIEKLEELLIKTKDEIEELNRQKRIDEYLAFIEMHEGEPPSLTSQDTKESSLASFFNSNNQLFSDEQQEKIQSVHAKYIGKKEDFIKKYTEFFRKNKRKPMPNSTEEERKLFISYNRWIMLLTDEEKAQINRLVKTVSKNDQIRNSFEDFMKLKNKK